MRVGCACGTGDQRDQLTSWHGGGVARRPSGRGTGYHGGHTALTRRLPHLHTPEPLCHPATAVTRAVLGDLLRLGFHFKAVAAFVEREQSPWDPRHATRSPSVYRRALASGLTGACLAGPIRVCGLWTGGHRMWW